MLVDCWPSAVGCVGSRQAKRPIALLLSHTRAFCVPGCALVCWLACSPRPRRDQAQLGQRVWLFRDAPRSLFITLRARAHTHIFLASAPLSSSRRLAKTRSPWSRNALAWWAGAKRGAEQLTRAKCRLVVCCSFWHIGHESHPPIQVK